MSGGMAHFVAMAVAIAIAVGALAARDYWFGESRDNDTDSYGDDDLKIHNPSPPPPGSRRNSRRTGKTPEAEDDLEEWSPIARYAQRRIVERESGGWSVLYPGDPGYDEAADDNPRPRPAPRPAREDRPLADAVAMFDGGYAWAEVVQMLMREHGQSLRGAAGVARRAKKKGRGK